MIKKILVPASGSNTDSVVFAAGLAAARLYDAHLEFYHVHISPGEALAQSEHARYLRGRALHDAVSELSDNYLWRSALAERHVQEFCSGFSIRMTHHPHSKAEVTASWRTESDNGAAHLVTRARYNDLVVMGRYMRPNGLPSDLLATMVLESGRPILVAGDEPPDSFAGTVAIFWKDTRESARAVSAAMPILEKAASVFVLSVAEGDEPKLDSVEAVAAQLLWHGIRAQVEVRRANGCLAAELLQSMAEMCGANLLIMGGYSKGTVPSVMFGGCTDMMLKRAHLPVLMVH